ncbi:transcription factor IIIA-like [Euwallacea fornicatus]|uniref:transcription factor IIIA-like n=1 Tax=Euwallacea fornicatus TaxID=995702 RepID=UPI00338EFE4B
MSFGNTSEDNSSDSEWSPQSCYSRQNRLPSTSSTALNPQRTNQKSQPLTLSESDLTASETEAPQKQSFKKDSKTHKCPEPECKAVFSRPYRLKNHIASRHNKVNLFKCSFDDCNKSYSSQSHLKRHKHTAHNAEVNDSKKEIICNFEGCGLVCANKYSLKKHINYKHVNLPFECSACKEKFRRKSYLNAHQIECHDKPAPYRCEKCSQSFSHYHMYHKHVTRHKTYNCDCGSSFEKWSQYMKHKKVECTCPKAEHICSICKKKFTAKQHLKEHSLKVHVQDSQNDNFTCPYLDCKRSYKYKKNLTSHIKTFHDKIFEYFKCSQDKCEAVLKTKKTLKQHLRLCHSHKPLKEKLRRKPRKDKGSKKKITALKLSGLNNGIQEAEGPVEVDNLNEDLQTEKTLMEFCKDRSENLREGCEFKLTQEMNENYTGKSNSGNRTEQETGADKIVKTNEPSSEASFLQFCEKTNNPSEKEGGRETEVTETRPSELTVVVQTSVGGDSQANLGSINIDQIVLNNDSEVVDIMIFDM